MTARTVTLYHGTGASERPFITWIADDDTKAVYGTTRLPANGPNAEDINLADLPQVPNMPKDMDTSDLDAMLNWATDNYLYYRQSSRADHPDLRAAVAHTVAVMRDPNWTYDFAGSTS